MSFLNNNTYSCNTSVMIDLLAFVETESNLDMRLVTDNSTMSSEASSRKRAKVWCRASGPTMAITHCVIRDLERAPDLSLRVSVSTKKVDIASCNSCQASLRPV